MTQEETGTQIVPACAVSRATERLVDAAKIGREAAHTPEALTKEAETQRRHAKARSSWLPSSQPAWLTPELYSEKIQPRLAQMSSSAIASCIEVSRWYAGRIREGYRPHPRHWLVLAQLVGISPDSIRDTDISPAFDSRRCSAVF
jgi:hypothetical protein